MNYWIDFNRLAANLNNQQIMLKEIIKLIDDFVPMIGWAIYLLGVVLGNFIW